jgi:uncharacterized protein YaaW (UPF0174 family)
MHRRRLFSGESRSYSLARLAFKLTAASIVVGGLLWALGAVKVAWGIIAVAAAIGCLLLVAAVRMDRDDADSNSN